MVIRQHNTVGRDDDARTGKACRGHDAAAHHARGGRHLDADDGGAYGLVDRFERAGKVIRLRFAFGVGECARLRTASRHACRNPHDDGQRQADDAQPEIAAPVSVFRHKIIPPVASVSAKDCFYRAKARKKLREPGKYSQFVHMGFIFPGYDIPIEGRTPSLYREDFTVPPRGFRMGIAHRRDRQFWGLLEKCRLVYFPFLLYTTLSRGIEGRRPLWQSARTR